MAANGNGHSNNLNSYQISSYHADDLEIVLKTIRTSKMMGALTINFDQGVPRGTVEWKEKMKPSSSSYVGPLRSLVK